MKEVRLREIGKVRVDRAELARSHGYQVDVEPLRGVGELLVLAASRRLDQPD